jgi:hypothetical protein
MTGPTGRSTARAYARGVPFGRLPSGVAPLLTALPALPALLAYLAGPDGLGGGSTSLVAVAAVPLGLALVGWLRIALWWSALPATAWSAAETDRMWAAADAGALPATPEEAIGRPAQRLDGDAVHLRANVLALLGRLPELEAVLAVWAPADALGAARRARSESRAAWLRGDADDLSRAEADADAIPDERERRAEHFWNLWERARRGAASGRDLRRALAAASELVLPLPAPEASAVAMWRRQAPRAAAVPSLVVSAASVVMYAVLGSVPALAFALLWTALLAAASRRTERTAARRASGVRALRPTPPGA